MKRGKLGAWRPLARFMEGRGRGLRSINCAFAFIYMVMRGCECIYTFIYPCIYANPIYIHQTQMNKDCQWEAEGQR